MRNLSDDIFEPFLSIGKDFEVDKNLFGELKRQVILQHFMA